VDRFAPGNGPSDRHPANIVDAIALLFLVESGQVLQHRLGLPACLGYGIEESAAILSQPLLPLVHPEDEGLLAELRSKVLDLADGQAYRKELRLRAKNGAWISFTATVFVQERDVRGRPSTGMLVLKDVTYDRLREVELAVAQQSLEMALDPFFRVGYDGRVQAANKAACALVGCELSELLGRPLPYFDEAYALDLSRRQESMRQKGSASFETVLKASDGNPVPLEVSANHLVLANQEMLFLACRDLRPRQELQDRLLQVEKLETVSELVGGVAHDFNNLLAIITAGLDQARPDDDKEGRWKAMDDALERGAVLVRRMQAFARRRPVKALPWDLLGLVESCGPRLRGLLGPHMTLKTEGEANLPKALVDSSQLDEILLNLAMNARDATGGIGSLTLRVEPQAVAFDVAGALGVKPGDYLALHAVDDGPGVPSNIVARIFDPFFTTKSPGQGTGLGLASAYGIARQHGGRLELLPSARGAHFRVLVPAAPPTAPTAMRLPGIENKGTLLLVDDESSLLDLLAPALTKQGYRVTAANDGESALALWDAQNGADLLVTDLRMPGMDGRELARRLREKKPGLPVLFISGWSPETPDAGLETGTLLLPKPFRLTELYRALLQLQQN
jgi:two-component system cell cycle sensor histidine kinase/response regulator CckA